MAPRPQRMRTPTVKGAGLRAATLEPPVTLMAPPGTPVTLPVALRTRSASVHPRTMTPQEFDESYFTPTPAPAPKDSRTPQKVAELIVMKPYAVQNSIEDQSISPFDDVSGAQGIPNRAPSKQPTRSQRAPSKSATPSSGITKSAGKGRKRTPGAGNRASPATTPNGAAPAATSTTITPTDPKLAAMLNDLREQGRKTLAATDHMEVAVKEKIIAGKEARNTIKQVKKLTLAARKDAIKMAEQAERERDEAMETTREAWRIGERYR